MLAADTFRRRARRRLGWLSCLSYVLAATLVAPAVARGHGAQGPRSCLAGKTRARSPQRAARCTPPAASPWLCLASSQASQARSHAPAPASGASPTVTLWTAQPWVVQQQLVAGYVLAAQGPVARLPTLSWRVWVQAGQGEQLPNVHLLLRQQVPGHAALSAPSPWRVEVQAQRLREPGEGMVRAGFSRRFANASMRAGFAALDAELPPLLVPTLVNTRRLRRSGFAVGGHVGRLKRGGLRPWLMAGVHERVATTGVRIGAEGHLWLRETRRPNLDGRVSLDGAWVVPGCQAGGRPLGHVWGRLGWRALVGVEAKEPIVRVGGWDPGAGNVSARGPGHMLHESLLGHEDLAHYTNRVVTAEAGLVLTRWRGGQLGTFASAGRLEPSAQQRARLLRAAGVVAQVRLPWQAWPVALSYQVARRQGTTQGTWLHLITVGA